MPITWTKLNARLDYFLDDEARYTAAGERINPLFSERLRIESWNWAQRIFVNHTPRARSTTLTIETGEREAVLPEDFLYMQGIYDSDNERWWSPVTWEPGAIRYTDDDLELYWVFGNRLYLEDDIDTGSTDLTMYYWASYPDVEYVLDDDDDVDHYTQEVIYTPSWAELPLAHLCTASCMNPGEVFASDINQYKIRVDSGNPLHNPREQSIKFHLDMYNRLIGMFPPTRRDVMR